MSTFSQMIDELVAEHLRPDLLVSITAYTNQTIRELHAARNTGAPILFNSNRFDAEAVADASPFLWTIPSVPRFQRLETAYYLERGCYSFEKHPSRVYNSLNVDSDVYWYRGGSVVAFSGIGVGETVRLTYFQFPRTLKYYTVATRPAAYVLETESYTYHADYDVSVETRENAQELSTNWILLRWPDTVKQGVRAKIFARLGEERAKIAYSLFESMREALNASEQWQQGPIA